MGSSHEVIPIDWIAEQIPGMITWAGNVVQNPEGHNGPSFAQPSFCGDGIYKSNIADQRAEQHEKLEEQMKAAKGDKAKLILSKEEEELEKEERQEELES